MVRRDGAEAKKERMELIAKMILGGLTQNKELILSDMIAAIEYQFGLTKEKILEYLETLGKLGRFTLDKESDKIRPNE